MEKLLKECSLTELYKKERITKKGMDVLVAKGWSFILETRGGCT